jgi:hypothetical protein
MPNLVASSNGVNPLILQLIERYFPTANGIVLRSPYALPGSPGTYTFDDGITVYQVTIAEPKGANAYLPTLDDCEILVVDSWKFGEGKRTSKRAFTKAGKQALEAQIKRMRQGTHACQETHETERRILGLVTGRFLSEVPLEVPLINLKDLPILDLDQLFR